MSKELWAFYHRAHEIGGLNAQIRLAMLTGLPASKIGEVEDTPEVRLRFKTAMRQVEEEFKNSKNTNSV
jgi:hypothetical protein